MVEGIVNTEGTNAAGFYYDYGAVDEVAINAGGNTAEMPWPGVWSNFIAKSGGNSYHGKLYYDYQNEGIQATNIPDTLTALCPGGRCGNLQPSDLNRINNYHDLNGDIGGFIKKDKLWWYFSGRDQNIKSLLPNFPVKPFETSLRNLTGKATYALNQNNKFSGYAQGGKKLQPNRLDTYRIGATIARHESEDSTWRQEYWGHTYKAGWDSVINDKVFFEVRGGQFKYVWPNFRLTRGSGLPGHGQQPGARRQPRWLVQHPVEKPGARLGQLLQRRMGRQPQLQGRRRMVPRDLHRSPVAKAVRVSCQVTCSTS